MYNSYQGETKNSMRKFCDCCGEEIDNDSTYAIILEKRSKDTRCTFSSVRHHHTAEAKICKKCHDSVVKKLSWLNKNKS